MAKSRRSPPVSAPSAPPPADSDEAIAKSRKPLSQPPQPRDIVEQADDGYVPIGDRVARASLGDARAEDPLGGAFWTLQFAQAVSLIADGGLLWALVFWLSTDGKSSGLPLLSVVSPAIHLSLCVLPFFGLLGDRLPRKLLLVGSLGLRASVQLALALLLVTKQLGPSALSVCQIVSLGGTLLFEVTCPAMVPTLVTYPQAPRALGYGLSLPRAGFFLTSVFCLLMVAVIGPIAMLLCGFGFLMLALALLRNLTISGQPASHFSVAAAHRQFFDGVRLLLTTKGATWLAALALLSNFIVYPLFALSPYQRLHPATPTPTSQAIGLPFLSKLLPSAPPPQEQHDLEFWLVVGVVIGAALLQRRLKEVSTDRIFAASLLWFSLGIFLLAVSTSDVVAVLATILLGIALLPLAALTAGVTLLAVADGFRARVAALLLMLFLAGGELGQIVLRPLFVQHGARPVMLGIAVGLLLGGTALSTAQTLPNWLRSPERS